MQPYVVFLQVLEAGSFSKAAERLGYSQSAVSKMISSLEETLDVTLIRRSRYGISLTPEGERLLPYIKNAVAQYELLHTAVGDIHGLAYGEIRIGAFSSISKSLVAPMIIEFWKQYPDIRFTLLLGDYSRIAEMVQSGQLDIGFVSRGRTAGLQSTYINSDEFLLILPEDHPLTKKDHIPMKEIENERFLMIRASAEQDLNELREAFLAAGVSPNIVLNAHDDYTILTMIELGHGISILSENIIKNTSYRVAARHLDPPLRRDVCIITRDEETVPIACKRFVRFLLDRCGQTV